MKSVDLLTRLQGVKQTGPGQWKACCPAHEDGEPSLTVTDAQDRILVHCHAGCTAEAVVGALGLKMFDLYFESKGQRRARASPWPRIAAAKRLSPTRLQASGVKEATGRDGRPYLIIPYRDENGRELATRFRFALAGKSRFRWKRGTRAKGLLYGRERLPQAHAAGRVTLWEGESDVQACWEHDVPALGIPGVENVDPERLARDLAGIPTIYLNREPGDAPAALLRG